MIPMSSVMENKRIFWADACRVLAILGVILIHSSGATFYSYGKIPIGHWLSANFIDSLARVGVPLFVMISGALLLKTAHSPTISFISIGRRIVKVLLPLIAWSMFYLWWVYFNTPSAIISPLEWLRQFLSHPVMYHLWFVYVIIGLYILLPIFQVLFKACESEPRFAGYFFAVWMVINSLSIYIPMPFIVSMQITMLFGYGGYFLLGGVLKSPNWDHVSFFKWGMLYLTGVIFTFLITWMRTRSSGVPDELGYSYFSPNVLIASVGAFMMVRKIHVPKGWEVQIVQRISDACFFIYFVHILVMEFLRHGTFGVKISTNDVHPILSIPILALATFVLSLALAVLVRLIPGSRRVFG